MLACLVIAGGVALASAQQAEPAPDKPAEKSAEKPANKTAEKPDDKPEVVVEDDSNSYDGPGGYTRVRFGKRPAAADDDGARLRTRVYLIDVSAGMAETINAGEANETTRLKHMQRLVEQGLDALSRRNVQFNIVTFGQIHDFAKGGELKAANAQNSRLAKTWLNELNADGKPDLYALLTECYKQEPDEATLIVGSMPLAPTDVTENDLKIAGGATEYIIRRIAAFRASGKKTTLDITGVGLSAEEKKFYQRLAEAGGGAYLDG